MPRKHVVSLPGLEPGGRDARRKVAHVEGACLYLRLEASSLAHEQSFGTTHAKGDPDLAQRQAKQNRHAAQTGEMGCAAGKRQGFLARHIREAEGKACQGGNRKGTKTSVQGELEQDLRAPVGKRAGQSRILAQLLTGRGGPPSAGPKQADQEPQCEAREGEALLGEEA
jgi:hypothetical protein